MPDYQLTIVGRNGAIGRTITLSRKGYTGSHIIGLLTAEEGDLKGAPADAITLMIHEEKLNSSASLDGEINRVRERLGKKGVVVEENPVITVVIDLAKVAAAHDKAKAAEHPAITIESDGEGNYIRISDKKGTTAEAVIQLAKKHRAVRGHWFWRSYRVAFSSVTVLVEQVSVREIDFRLKT